MHAQALPAAACACAAPGEAPLPDTLARVAVQRWTEGHSAHDTDWAAEEVPVSLEYNGIGQAVMMCTPAALEDFGVGFSISEGIVAGANEVLDIEVEAVADGVRIAMRIAAQRFAALKLRRRSLAGRTGCGLCGVDSLDQALRPLPPLRTGTCFGAAQVAAAMAALDDAQPLRDLSGATHAAAWMDGSGRLAVVREDVGRHNALDKVIGALARAGVAAGDGAALLTSRASVEMVSKAAAAGIGLLVARSAPTALAIRRAQALNLTLAGFARRGRHSAYSHAWRLHAAPVPGDDT